MRGKKRMLTAALIGAVALTAAGCGPERTGGIKDVEFESYPLQGDYTVTYFLAPAAAVTSMYENMGETEFAKELTARTGIKVKYIHPAAGQGEQALSLMIASDEMADIIQGSWATYAGGPAKTIADGTILELNGLMKDYAPNLSKFLSDNPEIDKMVKTDKGQYYAFPFIRNSKYLLCATAIQVRRDMLKAAGLAIPETISEFENMLKTFKDKGVEIPLTCASSHTEMLLNIFGATNNFYVDNGQVVYGPMTDTYRTALTKLNEWYQAGLLDGNFVANDQNTVNANVLNDKSVAVIGSGGGNLGTWLGSAANPDFDMVGIPYPANAEGKHGYFTCSPVYSGHDSAAITTSCENPAVASLLLDYAYGEEGQMLYNYGVEGKSYTMENGIPTYTDEIYNNPNGLTIAQSMANWFLASSAGPFIQQENYIRGFYQKPQQKESLDNWLKYYDDMSDMLLPTISRTPEEADEYSSIMNEVNKYVARMRTEFIVGTSDMSQFDKFVEQLKSLNIDKAIETTNQALQRYNAR